jgi:transcriptional regulator of acetoin/glycerol metabolism
MSTRSAARSGAVPGAGLIQPPAHQQSIARSHERCAALGVDALAVPDLSPVPHHRLREIRDRHQRLYQHAAPVMEMLLEQIISTRSVVVLTDSQGTILHSIGDDGFMEKAQQIALAPGVNWSEATKGTNAVGTALFDETATLVHANEHFIRANHFLTCSAAPIFDHAGQVMGVLDVTGDHRSYHPHTLAMVGMSAQMIENHWFSDRFRHGLRLHFHPRAELLGTVREGLLAVSPDGAILGANRTALSFVGTSAAALRMEGLEGVFGVSVPAVVDHCRRHGDQPLAVRVAQGPQEARVFHMRAFFSWPTLWPGHGTHEVASPAHAANQASAPSLRPTRASLVQPAAARTTDAAPEPQARAGSLPVDVPPPTLEAVELDTIRRAVEAAGGNISKAARHLGIGRNTIYRKLKQLTDS